MKFRKILIPLISLFMLSGCVNPASSSQINSEISSEVSSEISSDVSTSQDSSSQPSLDVTTFADGGVGGSLIEIGMGDYLQVGRSYNCSFTPSDCENKKCTAVYDETMIKVEFDEYSVGGFKITALKAGDSLLRLYSVELDCLVCREIIHCRDAIPAEQIDDYIFRCTDKWVTAPMTHQLAGSYKLVVMDKAPLECSMQGASELNEQVRAVFTATYSKIHRINEFLFYEYELECDADRTQATYAPKTMYVALTGCNILLYDNEGVLINMFYPEEVINGGIR